MSNEVSRAYEVRPEREVLTAKYRRRKAIGMAKQKFAYAIVDASMERMDRELLYGKIKVYLENFRESDGKPTVEDFDEVARELSCLDAFASKDDEVAVADIPRHSKAKSTEAPKDPVERALESQKNRKKAIADNAKPAVLTSKDLGKDDAPASA